MAQTSGAKSRPIFQEVSGTDKVAAAPGGIDAGRRDSRRAIRIWMYVLFVLVAAMIIVGGLTRLADAGLSITEWKPLTGAIPPMNAADWEAEFALYRAIPQYELMNQGMTLAEFKVIYWWEWGHRQLGRVMGLVWAIGFLWFYFRRAIPAGWTGRLLWLGVLGGAQGAIGWWMVSSGLVEGMATVASYRLATHLGLAFVILGFIAWYTSLLERRESDLMNARRAGERKLFGGATGLMHLAFLQILLGALVAGIDAGRAFPTWPDMAGGFFPPDPFMLNPAWRNFFENAGLVQFMHRMAGYLLLVLGVVVWLRGRKSPHPATRRMFHAILIVMLAQVALGIVTVLTSATLHSAITHQIGAMVLWVLILRGRYLARYPISASVRDGVRG